MAVNPLADSTMDELKIVKVSLVRHSLLSNKNEWIATLRVQAGGYFDGRGESPATALDDALRTLAERPK